MSNMLEDVKYDSKNNFIVVNGRAEPNAEQIKQAFRQGIELSKIEKCNNLLIDGTKTTTLPPITEIYSVSLFLLTLIKNLVKMRIAYVSTKDIADGFRLLDSVISKRGIPIGKFNNLEDAKEWLLNK